MTTDNLTQARQRRAERQALTQWVRRQGRDTHTHPTTSHPDRYTQPMPRTDPKNCKRCGQPHEQCTAHNKAGLPCGARPKRGQRVCRLHGGSSPQAKAKAQERIAKEEVERAAARFGLLGPELEPRDALLAEVRRTANMVEFYAEKIRLADPDTDPEVLTWGVTAKTEREFDDTATVETKWTAAPTVLVKLWMDERKHLADVAAAAVRAGVELEAVQRGIQVVLSWPTGAEGTRKVEPRVVLTTSAEGAAAR